MRIRALESCELIGDDGEPIPLQRQVRRLAVFLATRPQRTGTIDALIDALWGEAPPASARQTIHVLVNRLRSAAGAGIVDRVAARYQIHVVLDIDEILAEFDQAETLESSDPMAAALAMERALAASTGSPFGEFPDERWLEPTIATFAERRRVAEERWASLRLLLGTADEVIDRLEVAVRAEPLRELRWEQLMLALYQAGRQSEALAAYDRARMYLRDSLGLEPGPALQRLHRAILDHAVPVEVIANTSATETARGDAFVGRRDELKTLERLATRGRLVTVVGIGGIGKSRLADEFAHRRLLGGTRVHRLGVLEGMREEDLARSLVLATNRAAAESDLPPTDLCVELARQLDLVIVDAAERSAGAAAALVERLVDRCPQLVVVVTSRHPLDCAAEVVMAIDALSMDSGPTSEAHQLFADRLGIEIEELSDDDWQQLDQVVHRTAGIPVLLEIAAATFDPQAEAGAPHVGDDGGGFSIGDAIAEAKELIEPAAAEFAVVLASMPDGLATETVEHWIGDRVVARRVLRQLRSVRLVTTKAGTEGIRYRVLDPIADALQAPLDHEARDTIHRRAAQVFGELFRSARPIEARGIVLERIGLLDDESENLGHTIDYWIDRDDGSAALRLAADAAGYWWHRASVTTSFERVTRALHTGHPTAEEVCEGLCTLAEVACDTFRVATLRAEFEAALGSVGFGALAPKLRAKITLWTSLTRGYTGDLPGCDELLAAAVPLVVDDPWMATQRDQIVAMRRVLDGAPDDARRDLRRCATTFSELGDENAAATALYIAATIGDLVESADTLDDVQAARSHAERGGSDRILPRLVFVEASVLSRDVSIDDASLMEGAAIRLERAGFLRQGGLARRNLGIVRLANGNRSGAVDDFERSTRRLLDFDLAAAALGLAGLGVLESDARVRRTMIATASAWRAASTIPESVADRRRWDLVIGMCPQDSASGTAAVIAVEAVKALLEVPTGPRTLGRGVP